jgi:ribosomal protein S27AE
MKRLFIDANIYLGFYNSNASEFKKLLKATVEVSDKIIITQQIIDEICRNKLNVFRQSIENYLKDSHIKFPFLPEHLDRLDSAKLKSWNNRRKELEAEFTKLNSDLETNLKEVFNSISESSDVVSDELQAVFSKLLPTTQEAFEKAMMRKTIGNPPGKPNDPLGDQLSWEVLLENIAGVSELYIVTNDGDYSTNFNGSFLLNPILYNDLVKINQKLKIYVYNKLSVALQDFNKSDKIESLPNKTELEVIIHEEPEIYIKPNIKFYGGEISSFITRCPACGTEISLANVSYIFPKEGPSSKRYTCPTCGYHYNSMDS